MCNTCIVILHLFQRNFILPLAKNEVTWYTLNIAWDKTSWNQVKWKDLKKELDKSKKNEYNKSRWNGSLAQLVEHLTLNQGVRGSNPWWSTRHSARSHGWLRVFFFLPNSHKIHHFYQYFYKSRKCHSAVHDGMAFFWCSVTGFIIFFVRKKYLPVIKVWRYNQSTLAACSI